MPGHSDYHLTMRIYTGVFASQEDGMNDAQEEMFAQAVAQPVPGESKVIPIAR